MLCVCVLLHCQQICAERKFRKIESTYLHSLYSCTTLNVTMCFNSLEWHAREVCLLQNNFSELWLINSLNEWTIHHCAKKNNESYHPSNMTTCINFQERHKRIRPLCCDWFGTVRYGNSPIDPKIANQRAALEWCRSTVHLMILIFFFYSKIDLNLFTYCFFKACILLMDHRSLKS